MKGNVAADACVPPRKRPRRGDGALGLRVMPELRLYWMRVRQ